MVAAKRGPQQPQPKTVFDDLPSQTVEFYLQAMKILDRSGVPYLVGGAYALAYYAGIVRHTKDFDTFVRAQDVDKALRAFDEAGYRTEKTHPHWVAKAFSISNDDPDFVDLIYGSGNGICPVDDAWFDHSVDGELLGRSVRLCPVEEMIWSKSFVMERDRFDGADIQHLLLARADTIDWRHLIARFQGHERVLLAHLVLFNYVYPSERGRVPTSVIDALISKLHSEPPAAESVCRGTLLSWKEYLPDVQQRGMEDARLQPRGNLTPQQIARWTAAQK